MFSESLSHFRVVLACDIRILKSRTARQPISNANASFHRKKITTVYSANDILPVDKQKYEQTDIIKQTDKQTDRQTNN